MPRAAADRRRERDALVLRMFLAGSSYRQIAKHPMIPLSPQAVSNVVQRELAADAPHREALSQQAADIYLLRLERMLAAAMPQALQCDWKAWGGLPPPAGAAGPVLRAVGRTGRERCVAGATPSGDAVVPDAAAPVPDRHRPRGHDQRLRGNTQMHEVKLPYSHP